MSVRTTEEVIAAARARFDAGGQRATSLEKASLIVGVVFGGGVVVIGVPTITTMAFMGDTGTQSAAQMVVVSLLMVAAFCAVLELGACLCRGWWVRSAVLLVVATLAVIAIAHADLTSALPFG